MNLKIGVLLGGRSEEREVSLRSGEAVYQALTAEGYNAVKIDVDADIAENLKREKVQLAFIVLHGKYGEDGAIQGLLEILNIPYTGSGILASAIAMDKIATKKTLSIKELLTPQFIIVSSNENIETISNRITDLGLPVVIKAPSQGSSIGVSFAYEEKDIAIGLSQAFQYGHHVLVEKMIEGVEVTASVIGNAKPEVLPLIEINSTTGIYDYQAKYTKGLSNHTIPPNLPENLQQTIKELAIKAYLAIDCRGFSRIDFIVDSQTNQPYILEVNTIPGLTDLSLFPDAAKAAGMSFNALVSKLVALALEK